MPDAVPGVSEGDMVVVPDGRVGLLMEVSMTPMGAAVMFVSNGRWHHYASKRLRRATMAEIIAAGLHGVGCNQAYDQ